MTGSRYESGVTTGGKWGCALSAVVGFPLIGLVVLASALGDCVPDTSCNRGLAWWLLVPAVMIAMAVGFGARALVNWLVSRRRKVS